MEEKEILKLLSDNPNEVFNFYYNDIKNVCGYVARRYNWEPEDLMSYSYFKFKECSEKFDPNYGDGKMKFVQFYVRCLQWHLPAYIRQQRRIENRQYTLDKNINEQEEYGSYVERYLVDNSYERYGITRELQEYVDKLPDKYKIIIQMSVQGYKQPEIAKKVGLTQSRISMILKKMREMDNVNRPLQKVGDLIRYLKIDYKYDPNEIMKNQKVRKKVK